MLKRRRPPPAGDDSRRQSLPEYRPFFRGYIVILGTVLAIATAATCLLLVVVIDPKVHYQKQRHCHLQNETRYAVH